MSWLGMKPVGITLKPNPVSTSRPAYTASETPVKRMRRRTPPEYAWLALSNPLLKRRKNQPSAASMPRVRRSFLAACGRSSSAASAGERVSELNAEITVATAMVSANCL